MKLQTLFASIEAPALPSGFYLQLKEKKIIGYELPTEKGLDDPEIKAYLKSETISLDSLTQDQRYLILHGFVQATDIRDVVVRLQEDPNLMQEFLLLNIERLPTSDWNRVESLMALNKHLPDSEAVKDINKKSLNDEYEDLQWQARSYFEKMDNKK